MGRLSGGGDPDTGLAHSRARLLAAFIWGLFSPISPFPRLYLSLVLGNVNVTLLSKQAK